MTGPVVLARGRTAEGRAWGTGQVLKLFYDRVEPGWIRHEAEVAALVRKAGLPTSPLLEREEVEGRPGLVYERAVRPSMLTAAGSPALLEVLSEGLPPGSWTARCVIEWEWPLHQAAPGTAAFWRELNGDRSLHPV